jgi:hypothetical protein
VKIAIALLAVLLGSAIAITYWTDFDVTAMPWEKEDVTRDLQADMFRLDRIERHKSKMYDNISIWVFKIPI